MEITPKMLLLAAVGLGSPTGAWLGGVKAVDWMDHRYASQEAVSDVQWSALKGEIRQIDKDIAEAVENGREARAQDLRLDRQDVVDRLCKAFPDDRECKREA